MTTPPQQKSDSATPRRARNITFWALQILTAAGFLMAALGKFTGAEQIVATFNAIGFGDWFRYLVGALEVTGAVALFIPPLAGLAGLAFVALTVGAVLTQLLIGASVAMPLPLLILATAIAWGRRRSTTRLWARLARQ